MPELPEVETIRLGLQKYLVGHIIESVELRLHKQFTGDPQLITGAKIIKVERFGKGLVITLDNNYSLAIHIKMTGQLIYQDGLTKNKPLSSKAGRTLPHAYTHVIFHLDHQASLFYNDLRQFGWIKIVPTDKIKELPFFKDLGPELMPSSGQEPLTQESLAGLLSKAKTMIKPVLMDQKKIGGIGNIYANDALFLAKINPQRPSNSLSKEEVLRLFKALLQVLRKGIAEGGSSSENYVNALGQEGNYQNHTLVYGKEGQKCPNCGEIIQKTQLAGRGTYFCPNCQR